MLGNSSFETVLSQWLAVHSLDRRPRTVEFNTEIFHLVKKHWPDLNAPAVAVSADQVLAFAQRVAHYGSSRWNAMVGALRFCSPHGKKLRYRRARCRVFSPPNQIEFSRLLAECDASPAHARRVDCEVSQLYRLANF